MRQKLLTIIVPTYNRARSLALLLDTLRHEIAPVDDSVDIVVGDNASTDGTADVTTAEWARRSAAEVRAQRGNVGPEGK